MCFLNVRAEKAEEASFDVEGLSEEEDEISHEARRRRVSLRSITGRKKEKTWDQD